MRSPPSSGSSIPLDVRRAQALGYLARGQRVPAPGEPPSGRAERLRQVVLHLAPRSGREHGSRARATDEGRLVVTAERLREWLGLPEVRIVVKPVIDLAAQLHADAYEIPDRLREQVVLRDRCCVFPWCDRPARGCEVDHIVPFEQGGLTSTDNLAALCKRHHRHKTHGGWSYRRIGEARYAWMSPHGVPFLHDHRGSCALE